MVVSAIILAIPGILYVTYYTHLYDDALWYLHLRTTTGSEILAGGAGIVAGMVVKKARAYWKHAPKLVICILAGSVLLPHIKPLLFGTRPSRFSDSWQNGVCLQSINSSCGPASAATILRKYGHEVTEAELSLESFCSLRGTENWYIARAVRKRGFKTHFKKVDLNKGEMPVPSVAGFIMPGGAGHFVAILEASENHYIIADPLSGRKKIAKSEIQKGRTGFNGFFLQILDE